jgi:hypothetical protein
VFEIAFSFRQNGDGVINVWNDGMKVFTKTGPNTYNDETAPHLKFGLYIPGWRPGKPGSSTTKRTLYFDDFEVGLELCSPERKRSWCPGGRQEISVPFTPTIASPYSNG